MEREIPGGADEVEHDKREHAELVVTMKKLENVDADDEESDQFPLLRKHLSAETLVDLGEKVEAAKQIAPTRPHPGAPHSELFHMTIGAGVGMVDRLRDALTGRLG